MKQPATDQGIELALFKLGCDNQIMSVATSFLPPAIIAAGYYATLPRPQLWWWLGLMMFACSLVAVNRGHAWLVQRRGVPDQDFVRRWRRRYMVSLIMIGFGWGNLGMLFVPGDVMQN